MSNHYIGNRYVPKILRDDDLWTNTKAYEALTVVPNQGNSYTSIKPVPVGVDILNKDYWACTGNYNVQVEQYRTDSKNAVDNVNLKLSGFENIQDGKFTIMLNDYKTQINAYADGKYSDINAEITTTNNNLQNAKDSITAEMSQMENNLQATTNGYVQTVNTQMASIETMLTTLDIVYDEGTSTDVDGEDITVIDEGAM